MSVLKNFMEQISASTESIFVQEQVITPVIIDGRETLGPLVYMDLSGTGEGRMVGLLPRKGRHDA